MRVFPRWFSLYGRGRISNLIELSEVRCVKSASEDYTLFVNVDGSVKDCPLHRKIAIDSHERPGIKSLTLSVVGDDTKLLKHVEVAWKRVVSMIPDAGSWHILGGKVVMK